MFMFNTQNLHNFIQNYFTIIAWIYLKCKSYILHIKTSQVEKTYHLSKSNMYIFMSFLHLKPMDFTLDTFMIFAQILLKFHDIVSL